LVALFHYLHDRCTGGCVWIADGIDHVVMEGVEGFGEPCSTTVGDTGAVAELGKDFFAARNRCHSRKDIFAINGNIAPISSEMDCKSEEDVV
jgi:hypothetical protein